ncbi:uncharacterized protein LOC121390140 isoform X2 [Gigantopelta aegis]|nr:uncharacterized protein LOC121390140 isoform X2 [Gigantopelta aegis]
MLPTGFNDDEKTSSTDEMESRNIPLKKRNYVWHDSYEEGQHGLDLAETHSSKVKRSMDYNSGPSWQYPSNLMVLLRGQGKRSLPITPELLEVLDSVQIPGAYPRKRFSAYTKNYLRAAAPVSSRRFMVWKDGNYILG